MKGKGFTDEQIRERYTDVCRQIGVSEASFYLWKKKKYAKFELTEIRELWQLRDYVLSRSPPPPRHPSVPRRGREHCGTLSALTN